MITKISVLSLNMYLVAYLFDQLLYPLWKELLGESQPNLMPFYPLIILSLVIGTLIASWIYESTRDLIIIISKKYFRKESVTLAS